jgi:hypothetical protein
LPSAPLASTGAAPKSASGPASSGQFGADAPAKQATFQLSPAVTWLAQRIVPVSRSSATIASLSSVAGLGVVVAGGDEYQPARGIDQRRGPHRHARGAEPRRSGRGGALRPGLADEVRAPAGRAGPRIERQQRAAERAAGVARHRGGALLERRDRDVERVAVHRRRPGQHRVR